MANRHRLHHPRIERKRAPITLALSALAYLCCFHSATGQNPEPIHPTASSVVYQTIPFFRWKDAVAHPFPGTYQIQIAQDRGFESILDDDTLPACIQHYSPTKELGAGRSYFWRVVYRDSTGRINRTSGPIEFTIREPAYIVDVAPRDTFADIAAKLSQAKANASKGSLLRFPPNHTFRLTQTVDDSGADQESGEGVLLNVSGASNLILDGRGSKIILRALPLAKEDITTRKVVGPGKRDKSRTTTRGCGFFFARQSRHIQVKNLILDYESDSLMQYAGQITAIDRAKGEITVKVDPGVYGNFEEMKHYKDTYFVDVENNQRIGNQGVAYPMNHSWQESALGDGRFRFQVGQWNRFGDELKIGAWAVTSSRGGDAFIAFNNCEDIVVNNCRVEGCRGRYFIVKHPQPNIRCINNQFVRTGGRIMGAPSGGVNNHGDYAWYENCVFEFTRDDSFHAGGDASENRQQTVLRNSTFRGTFRNTIWMHDDRCWIEGNQLFHCGITGINLSGSGLGGNYKTIDVGVIRNNLIADANKTSFQTYGDAAHINRQLRIEGNVVRNNRMDQAFLLRYVADSLFANNRVEATAKGWRVYSTPELQLGIVFDHCTNMSGEGNTISDQRLDKPSWLKVTDSCSEVKVSVAPPKSEKSEN